MKSTKLFLIMIYRDSTGLFSKTECDNNNLMEMLIPEWILQEWYKKNEKNFIKECEENSLNVPCFRTWITEVYTADDTDGLYNFSVQNGCEPRFGIDIDNTPNAVVYENLEYDTVIAFKGTTMECRKWAREHDWKFTIGYGDTEVDLDMLFH